MGALGLGRGVQARKGSQAAVASVPGCSEGVSDSEAQPAYRVLLLFQWVHANTCHNFNPSNNS